jgi:hypothetical protein
MRAIQDSKKHPVAIATFCLYLAAWVFFLVTVIQTGRKQAESGMPFCAVGMVVSYYFMLILSAFYLISTLFFAVFSLNQRFFITIAVGILLPMALAFLWTLFW